MPAFSTNAILLRRVDWGETSQLFSFYTERQGKVEAVGRGTKKTQSKLNGHIQFFSIINLLVAHGRNIDQLAGAQLEEKFFTATPQLQQVMLGSFILELVNQLTKPHQPDPRLFLLLRRSLQAVGQATPLTKNRCISLQRQFTIELLTELGYQPPVGIAADQAKLRGFLNDHLEAELKVKRFVVGLSLDAWLPAC